MMIATWWGTVEMLCDSSKGQLKSNGLVPSRPNADERNLALHSFGDCFEVAASLKGQLLPSGGFLRGSSPTWHRGVNGPTRGPVFDIARGQAQRLTIEPITRADFDFRQVIETIQVGNGELIKPIKQLGVAERNEVQPPASTSPSGGGTELTSFPMERGAELR
jgi:hypothetical protein